MFAVSKAAQAVSSAVLAEAIDFDGTNDYLSRSSDLVGNTDGKTFTFSAWVYVNQYDIGGCYIYAVYDATFRFRISIDPNGGVGFAASNPAGTQILLASTSTSGVIQRSTFTHILISIDLANTANRKLYINDVLVSVTYNTYTNSNIDFTLPNHVIGNDSGSGDNNVNGRLSNVFLDYTYRDLSVEANRRLFITADRKPAANQSALNPILYMPMSDPTQPGKNLGTGGDFTLTGVVARSGRGPSQFNAPYSDLNGTSQYLRHTGSMCANGKQMTVSICFNADTITNTYFFHYGDNTAAGSVIALQLYNGEVGIWGSDGGTYILRASAPVKTGRNYHLLISVDMSDPAKRHFVLNGNADGATWPTYTNANFAFSQTSQTVGAGWNGSPSLWMDGKVGNLWFHNSYIDLSQPANLAKFVTGTGIDAKPADLGANGELPFGTPPLIYLPMYGNNAGKNYGTGGDFTVNSGPYPGARGPNEFWGNKAAFASPGYLARTSAITGLSTSKAFSASFHLNVDSTAANNMVFATRTEGGAGGIGMYINTSGALLLIGYNAATSTILQITAGTLSALTQYAIHVCIDLADTSKRYVYVNGVSQSLTVTTYTNDSIDLSGTRGTIGAGWNGSSYASNLQGKLSEFYFTTDYIDFSQEANRLKFRDAFGNPVDLAPQIVAGTLPNPAIYMRFDPSNFGKNSGTGGDFTVNGTITDGGQL